MVWTRKKHFYHILFADPKIYKRKILFSFTWSVVWSSTGKCCQGCTSQLHPNHNDANLRITIIHDVISHWSGNLPEVLYLQLDNTCRENKNHVVFGYLNMLVELRVFQKVKVGFLVVGHTHDHIDQMFSRFSVTLRRKEVGSLPSLIECIKKSYMPEPIFLCVGARSIQLLQKGHRYQVCNF